MSCSTYRAEYERGVFLEEHFLKRLVQDCHQRFRLETRCHPQCTDEELAAKERDHDAFIDQYIREQRELISRRLEPLKKRAEDEKAREQERETNGESRIPKRGGPEPRQGQTESERPKGWWEWISDPQRENDEEGMRKFCEELGKIVEKAVMKALDEMTRKHEEEIRKLVEERKRVEEEMRQRAEETRKRAEEEKRKRTEEETRKRTEEEDVRRCWEKFEQARKRYRAKEKEKEREQRSQFIEKRYKIYDEEWSKLKLKMQTNLEGLRFSDIPWPTLFEVTHPAAVTPVAVRAFFTNPKHTTEKHRLSSKKQFNMELLRWHTDKFSQVVKSVVEGDRRDVYDAAEVVVRVLIELKAHHK
ncbi:uncharacterized protein ARMOST_12000 [Armillaria ostoyae]|uniref:Uncharacterized protein n=1 Tax=Armillaria ostoyae TaxID=47428 RepID=A0A284RIR5_ARMOS|nr:uncharacterized protein ARMOST_12000 [Armillaria ostoyae]